MGMGMQGKLGFTANATISIRPGVLRVAYRIYLRGQNNYLRKEKRQERAACALRKQKIYPSVFPMLPGTFLKGYAPSWLSSSTYEHPHSKLLFKPVLFIFIFISSSCRCGLASLKYSLASSATVFQIPALVLEYLHMCT